MNGNRNKSSKSRLFRSTIVLQNSKKSIKKDIPTVVGFMIQKSMQKVINISANYRIARHTPNQIADLIVLHKWGDRDFILSRIKSKKDNPIKKLWMSMFPYISENIKEYHNIVPLDIRTLYALQATWSAVGTSFEVNNVALWSDATPATINDTQLWTEILRTTFTNRYTIDQVAYFDKFYNSAEVSWNTYLEIWLFVDGDEMTPNSWILMSRVNIDEELGPNETLSINAEISFDI